MAYYSDRIKKKAFNLFCQGVPIEAIARKYFKGRPCKHTIWAWYNREGWAERKAEFDKEVDKELSENLPQIKARQRKICRGVIAKYLKDLRDNTVDVSTAEIERIMKHELLLAGEPTERTEGTVSILDLLEQARRTQNRTAKKLKDKNEKDRT